MARLVECTATDLHSIAEAFLCGYLCWHSIRSCACYVTYSVPGERRGTRSMCGMAGGDQKSIRMAGGKSIPLERKRRKEKYYVGSEDSPQQ
eukprot:508937-Pelagomonas_calceolata.AAC.3